MNLFLAVLWQTYHEQPLSLRSERAAEVERKAAAHARKAEQLQALVRRETMGEPDDALVSLLGKARVDSADVHSGHGWRGWRGGCTALRKQLALVVEERWFRLMTAALIVANALIMMLEREPMPAYERLLVDQANVAFTLLFACEMLAKLLGRGVHAYVDDPFDRFDGLVVLTSLLDLLEQVPLVRTVLHQSGMGPSGLGVHVGALRVFRLLRIFKLDDSWRNLQSVLTAIIASLHQLSNLAVILFLVISVFALLGRELFDASVLYVDGAYGHERNLYGSTENAMLTVFVVLGGEDWDKILQATAHTMRDAGLPVGPAYAFYILLIFVGHNVLLNLMVAVVIGGVVEATEEQEWHVKRREPTPRRRRAQAPRWVGDSGSCCGRAVGAAHGAIAAARRVYELRKDHSMLLLPPGHWLRRWALVLLTHPLPGTRLMLDHLVIGAICLGSVAITFHACDGSTDALTGYLLEFENVATSVSLVEIGAKVVAHGLLLTPGGFLRNGWNRFDAIVVGCRVIECMAPPPHAGATMVLRTFHVLRPLRIISRFEDLRLAVGLLGLVVARVMHVVVVYLLFLVAFALLGVQLFGGRFKACSMPQHATEAACVAAGGLWENPSIGSFDNFFSAALILFEISSLEGWPTIMFAGVDATEMGEAPQASHNMAASLYFIAWVLVGGMIFLNVLVGVLVDVFSQMQGILPSGAQLRWRETMALVAYVRPKRHHPKPGQWLRGVCWSITRNRYFDLGVLVLIVANTVLMGLEGSLLSVETERQLYTLLANAFALEALVKVGALSLLGYLSDLWNLFDFTLVCLALLDEFSGGLQTLLPGIEPTLLRILRALRAARLLRILGLSRYTKSLSTLLKTIYLSLPALSSILFIYLIVLFTFAVLGTELFGGVVHGEALNEDANFCNFGTAFLTLFRCSTGEGWTAIMHDLTLSPGHLNSAGRQCSVEEGNCGSWIALPFFIAFVVQGSFITIKMMIAVIIEHYKSAIRNDALFLRPWHIEAFQEAWALDDPSGSSHLPVAKLAQVIRRLPPPLGLKPAGSVRSTRLDHTSAP